MRNADPLGSRRKHVTEATRQVRRGHFWCRRGNNWFGRGDDVGHAALYAGELRDSPTHAIRVGAWTTHHTKRYVPESSLPPLARARMA